MLFRYRIEFVNDKITLEHGTQYVMANDIEHAIETFRRTYTSEFQIVEVSRCFEKDWNKY